MGLTRGGSDARVLGRAWGGGGRGGGKTNGGGETGVSGGVRVGETRVSSVPGTSRTNY